VLPIEQHIHSILDMAPIIGLAWLLATTWPAAARSDWSVALRIPGAPIGMWLAVLIPAGVLCGIPAMAEFRAARAATS
jgi:hypothetical protein